MKSLRIDGGYLLTEMTVYINGQPLKLNRVLVDTCATHSKLSIQRLVENGITLSEASTMEVPYVMNASSLSVGPLKIIDFPLEVKKLQDANLDGVLGLDFLKKVGAKINLDAMTLSGSRVI
ncbi:retropepsin-like aspartic protease [Evansella cellulosilytica]|uniref:Aspartyl protease n=1 Tax=Evansella cellulosilytica (strain ATCC 21833 / DSM 2522 / FERM P-1141 / JCM 9156 / N-4) TaxID=649639 RepID=E6TUB4_EVAC2|nr:retropepsin-like aspartic protease [Evansella cellulosilytica]ADU29670.1 hypothetical protein Bcell_1407 [Evansella cellulosilytica DSM 2522]